MVKEEEQLCGQIFHPPGVVHVAVLLVSLLDVEGCLRYSQVECIFIKFERVDLCAAFKLFLLVFLGGDRVRNLLRDTLLPVLVLTMQRLNRVSMPQAHKGFQNQLKRTFKVKYKRMLFQAPKCYSSDQLTMSWNNYSGSDLHES